MTARAHRLFGVTGWKNSGKTTLLTRLVENLTRHGFAVSTLKHAHHAFDIDHEGRDSWRHRHAGATETAVVSGVRWAIMHELRGNPEPEFTEILEKMEPCDLVLVEGYKLETHPKIEVLSHNTAKDAALWPQDRSIVALAAEQTPPGCDLPCFCRDDIDAISDFVIGYLQMNAPKPND